MIPDGFYPAKGLDHLYVSRQGQAIGFRGTVLNPHIDDKGYARVYPKGHSYKRLHRVIAETFLSPIVGMDEVNHKDGNKLNNAVDNLEWTDRLGNMRHAYDNKLSPQLGKGQDGLRAKLSQADVDFIRSNHIPRHPEYGQSALARQFNVTQSCIWRVVRNKNWGG